MATIQNHKDVLLQAASDRVPSVGTGLYCQIINGDTGLATVSDGELNFNIGGSMAGSYIFSAGLNTVTLTDSSDVNLKKDIAPEHMGISFINSLTPVSYRFKEPSEFDLIHHGFIAQEVGASLELSPNIDSLFTETNGVKGVGLNSIIAPLVKAVQELSSELKRLKNKIAD